MKWVKSPKEYKSVEDAILSMAGQTKKELLMPEAVSANRIEGIQTAAETILAAAEKGLPVVIVGDYDADGITSTAILAKLLSYFGIQARTIIPKRFTDGYGVSDTLLEGVADSLIITIDNGIAAGEVLDRASRERGNRVIVMDHHLPDGREPQQAVVIVDPHTAPERNGFVEYCGAGLAYKLSEYMLEKEPWPRTRKLMDDILALACIGTIGDAMPLVGDNRRIVMDGLALINSGTDTLPLSHGIARLIEIAGGPGNITQETIGYTIAPLINAPGRLYNAGGTSVLKMLLCDDAAAAMTYGGKMVQINKDRQNQVNTWMQTIQKELDRSGPDDVIPPVVYVPEMPEGLVGLVAGKLASAYHAPAIVLAQGENGVAKGSVRTYGEFNVKDMLDSMSGLFTTYGGHAGAAGISLAQEQVDELRRRVRAYYTQAGQQAGGQYIQYDLEITPDAVTSALAVIKMYQPMGHGVPNPIFRINGLPVDSPFLMGSDKSHIKFFDRRFSAVAFGMAQRYFDLGEPKSIDMVGTIGENTFQGRTTPQVLLIDFDRH